MYSLMDALIQGADQLQLMMYICVKTILEQAVLHLSMHVMQVLQCKDSKPLHLLCQSQGVQVWCDAVWTVLCCCWPVHKYVSTDHSASGAQPQQQPLGFAMPDASGTAGIVFFCRECYVCDIYSLLKRSLAVCRVGCQSVGGLIAAAS